MAKVQLKSDNINPFGGIYPVFGDIDYYSFTTSTGQKPFPAIHWEGRDGTIRCKRYRKEWYPYLTLSRNKMVVKNYG